MWVICQERKWWIIENTCSKKYLIRCVTSWKGLFEFFLAFLCSTTIDVLFFLIFCSVFLCIFLLWMFGMSWTLEMPRLKTNLARIRLCWRFGARRCLRYFFSVKSVTLIELVFVGYNWICVKVGFIHSFIYWRLARHRRVGDSVARQKKF